MLSHYCKIDEKNGRMSEISLRLLMKAKSNFSTKIDKKRFYTQCGIQLDKSLLHLVKSSHH